MGRSFIALLRRTVTNFRENPDVPLCPIASTPKSIRQLINPYEHFWSYLLQKTIARLSFVSGNLKLSEDFIKFNQIVVALLR